MLAKLFRASGDRIWEENSVASDSQTNEAWTWDARVVTHVTNYVTCHDKWQDCSCLVTRVLAARHQMTYYWDDTRYLVITSCLLMQPWHLVTTGSALVLKDKFIVATFLRTSLLKISVELCFILPWINWISESSLRVHHAAWAGFCWLIFVADPGLRCLIVSWLYAVRPVRRGLLISWFNQSELGILTSINSDSWSV